MKAKTFHERLTQIVQRQDRCDAGAMLEAQQNKGRRVFRPDIRWGFKDKFVDWRGKPL